MRYLARAEASSPARPYRDGFRHNESWSDSVSVEPRTTYHAALNSETRSVRMEVPACLSSPCVIPRRPSG